jgi:hypothetical protein
MSYTLKLTNGKILLTLADQQSDRVSTSLTMIGKNVNAYGTDLNDNFVRLMENFANTSAPTSPLTGQLWFNTTDQRMYVFNADKQARPVGGPIVQATQPTNLVKGDMWIDSANRRLKYYDGTNLLDSSTPYDYLKGKSGVLFESSTATTAGTQEFLGVYLNNKLLGIYSNTAFQFTSPYKAISGDTGMTSIEQGFNANSGAGIKFVGIASIAEGILSPTGTVLTANDLLIKEDYQVFTAGLTVLNDTPGLRVGENYDLQLWSTGTSITTSTIFTSVNKVATLSVNGEVQDFNLEVNTSSVATAFTSALYIDATNARVGIFNTRPQSAVDITGDVNINGNLSISGSSTYITSSNLRVDDKLIELANTTGTAIDSFANGGGILLHGNTDKSIRWYVGSEAWTSNQNFDLTNGRSYKIAGTTVLSSGTLSESVTSAPGLTSVGVLSNLTVSQVIIYSSTIATSIVTPLYIGGTNTTLIDFNGKKLINVATPDFASTSTQVATKKYVDDNIASNRVIGQYSTTIDVSGFAVAVNDPLLDPYVLSVLELMFPPTDPAPYNVVDGSRARVMVVRYTTDNMNNVASNFLNPGDPILVDSGGVLNSKSAIEWSTSLRVTTTIPAQAIGVNRAIKQYVVSNGAWIPLPIGNTPSNTVYTDGTW